ncbi:10728_t:CDS:2, partial [Acaulospora colombiana]
QNLNDRYPPSLLITSAERRIGASSSTGAPTATPAAITATTAVIVAAATAIRTIARDVSNLATAVAFRVAVVKGGNMTYYMTFLTAFVASLCLGVTSTVAGLYQQ